MRNIGLFLDHMLSHTTNTVGRMLRQLGLEFNVRAARINREITPFQPLNRHRNILSLYERHPSLSSTSYVAPNATIVGSVYAAANTRFSFGSVVIADRFPIRIGTNTRIGENTVIECLPFVPNDAFPQSTNIGNNVRIEHNCALISCIIDDNVHIGHRSSIHQGVQIQRGAVIGPNSVVPAGSRIPQYTLWAGTPVQFIRHLTQQQKAQRLGQIEKNTEENILI